MRVYAMTETEIKAELDFVERLLQGRRKNCTDGNNSRIENLILRVVDTEKQIEEIRKSFQGSKGKGG